MALAVALFARLAGFDRDRSFYATVLMVVASYYVLFAVIGGSAAALIREVAAMAVFVLLAAVGVRRLRWLLVIGFASHGVFDQFHGHFIDNPGVPLWWPQFCLTYDLAAAVLVAVTPAAVHTSGKNP